MAKHPHVDLSPLAPHIGGLSGEARASLGAELAACADPGRAVLALAGILEADRDVAPTVLAQDAGRRALVTLLAASRSIGQWLRSHPDEAGPLASATASAPLPGVDTLTEMARCEAEAAGDPIVNLRRFRRRWFMRIALRDLLMLAPFEEVGTDLSDLADACLEAALLIATEGDEAQLAIVAMGKHGGRELNYASDVDVLFIGEDDAPAKRLLSIMAHPSPEGIVWRTDADLRPEGRAGRLVRSLGAYEAYYQRWADAWELQALLKRRPAAGDLTQGHEFCAMSGRFLWDEPLPADALEELRGMKARTEEKVTSAGLSDREVKLGPGGIRDVEFAVQLLQLVHGRGDPDIRSNNTLEALEQLSAAGYVSVRDAEVLSTAYRKLRSVEHMLQLDSESQTHSLPTGQEHLERLARLLGFRADAADSATDHFLDDFRENLATVRSVHERLFYRPLLEAFAHQATADSDGQLTETAAEERLAAFGFADARATRRALETLTSGLSRRSNLMAATLPLVLDWLSGTPDPDLGLLMLERITSDRHRAETLTAIFRESPLAAQRLCTLIGTSRSIGEGLESFPELLLMLEDDSQLARVHTRDELVEGASRQLAWREDSEGHKAGLRRFVRRERTRIGIRDILGFTDPDGVAAELTALAEACLEAGLRSVAADTADLPPIAVIGMGRLGGGELAYTSDVDILLVYGDGTHTGTGSEAWEESRTVEKTAKALVDRVAAHTADGLAFDVDLDLRPEGKSGVIARRLPAYVQYWERWAETWEFQALLRARPVAGDPDLGAAFMAAAEPFVYRDPFPEQWLADVRLMKARIDRERLPKGTDPHFHLKLGRGGLVEIEFAVQLLQLRYGATDPTVRTASTHLAIEALVESGHVSGDTGDRLDTAYAFVNRVRNRMALLDIRDTSRLPASVEDLDRLARSLGYAHHPAGSLREDYRRVTRLAHNAADAILYPEGPASWR
ncbi:MAG: bifunctional [glutamine synthetase] adenylyltransferase/[glutamine synthetase]-adenylyl-L-tyrosine phosphorylase [Acidimicrobiia bacterium]|nr:bifunctional [glutamine synthetase] adenylyltransferase/[glutamine synthetase]-adenylyl-L-tyrosine phosphorylase [Acidimicrobiia bacterium]